MFRGAGARRTDTDRDLDLRAGRPGHVEVRDQGHAAAQTRGARLGLGVRQGTYDLRSAPGVHARFSILRIALDDSSDFVKNPTAGLSEIISLKSRSASDGTRIAI